METRCGTCTWTHLWSFLCFCPLVWECQQPHFWKGRTDSLLHRCPKHEDKPSTSESSITRVHGKSRHRPHCNRYPRSIDLLNLRRFDRNSNCHLYTICTQRWLLHRITPACFDETSDHLRKCFVKEILDRIRERSVSSHLSIHLAQHGWKESWHPSYSLTELSSTKFDLLQQIGQCRSCFCSSFSCIIISCPNFKN